jgi:DNA-binding PadR family transcriptional regulator
MYTEIVILALLSVEPRHGYELKKQGERILGISLNNKVLYPALKRFEELGAVQREVERQEGKPDRHVYHITDRGKELLQAILLDYGPEIANSEAEFLTRVAFFEMLEPEARLVILETRVRAIEKVLARMQEVEAMAIEGGAASYHMRVIQFRAQQTRNEFDWLKALIEETQRER